MSNPLPDLKIVHKKTILTVSGPHKDFTGDGGKRQKFIINFADGYTAEICPLVEEVKDLPKSGQDFIFRVKHRGRFGDEIEQSSADQLPKENGSATSTQSPIISMSHHPATIALNAAIRLAELNKDKVNDPTIPSDVMAEADVFYEWLVRKAT